MFLTRVFLIKVGCAAFFVYLLVALHAILRRSIGEWYTLNNNLQLFCSRDFPVVLVLYCQFVWPCFLSITN